MILVYPPNPDNDVVYGDRRAREFMGGGRREASISTRGDQCLALFLCENSMKAEFCY